MEKIRIAGKNVKSYLQATFFVLDKEKEAKLAALGGRQNKLFEIAERLKKTEGIEIKKRKSIYVNKTPGQEITVEKTEVEE